MVRHKSFFLFVASLIILLRCIAYTDAEMHDQTNLWYGSEANLDEVWAGILESMKPPTNVIMEYEAFQVTNRIPVLAEIMASNREYAVRMGLDTNVISFAQRKALITAGTSLTQALNLSVRNLDSATNMLFLCSSHGNPSVRDVLIYKNLVLHMCAETNTVNAAALAAEIINAGLPEGERVALLPMP